MIHDKELVYLLIIYSLIFFLMMYTKMLYYAEMYVFYILIFILLYIFFINIYNNNFVKYIVVSKNKNNNFKIHTEPISLIKALEIQEKLQNQYNHKKFSSYYKYHEHEAFIIKFIKIT